LCQWARKPFHLPPKWKCLHEPHKGLLQPQSGTALAQVTGSAQPQSAFVVQEGAQPQPLSQPFPQPQP
jgi:hypothetical protein